MELAGRTIRYSITAFLLRKMASSMMNSRNWFAERLLRKKDRLEGKKLLLEWWEQFQGASFYDLEYVEELRQRIEQAQRRLEAGL